MTRHSKTCLLPATALLLICTLGACDRPDTDDAATNDAAGTGSADAATQADATPAQATADATTDSGALPADPAMTASDADARSSTPADAAGALSQDDALAVLAAINEHEIAAAKQARDKGVDGATRDFADLMQREHGKNLTETRALASVRRDDSPPAEQQRSKGKAELEKLAALQDDAYEKAYIDAMVKGHEEALATLDGKLMPAAQDAKVRQHFTTTREHVAMHLDKAKALQTQ